MPGQHVEIILPGSSSIVLFIFQDHSQTIQNIFSSRQSSNYPDTLRIPRLCMLLSSIPLSCSFKTFHHWLTSSIILLKSLSITDRITDSWFERFWPCQHKETYIHRYTHTYTNMHTSMHTYIYPHTYTHTYKHMHTHTYINIHTQTYIHTCIYIYTHTYTHIHIHKILNILYCIYPFL